MTTAEGERLFITFLEKQIEATQELRKQGDRQEQLAKKLFEGQELLLTNYSSSVNSSTNASPNNYQTPDGSLLPTKATLGLVKSNLLNSYVNATNKIACTYITMTKECNDTSLVRIAKEKNCISLLSLRQDIFLQFGC